tara:strand:+ start:86 stop:949 length:864 start_codon:yes stop_codon:yes gene_type:complete
MFNILVTGAEGQLGQCFQAVAKEFPKYNLFFVSKNAMDITKAKSIERVYNQHPFEGIINCAAYSKVDQAEIEIEKAHQINHQGIQNLVALAEQKDLFIIHFSTDYIFDGRERRPIKEENATNPLNRYAESKLAGEKVLSKSKCSNITFRVSWLFSPFGSNFVKTILRLSETKDEIKVVKDQFGRPTYGIDLARVVLDKLTHPGFFDFNCYHYASKGIISRFDLAKKVSDFSKNHFVVTPCLTPDYPTPAVRSKYTVLDTTRIENHLSFVPSTWENALQRCLKRIELK